MKAGAIRVEHIGKCYARRPSLHAHLARLLPRPAPTPDAGWALRDVSFEVHPGESVGIIGLNGSGKSTLLEIIAGTLKPTRGQVRRQGRVAALLELNSGFNPELSGSENLRLNGMLAGLSRHEVEHRFDDIARFADIGDVLAQPVRTYSSGMLARLAFSLHAVLMPDILIIDEILAVGDYFFQQKCHRRLAEMREQGMTLLFVSHDLALVRDICGRALYLKSGQVEYWGRSDAAIHRLLTDRPATAPPSPAAMPPAQQRSAELADAVWFRQPGPMQRLLAIRIVGRDGLSSLTHGLGQRIVIQAWFRTLPGDLDLVIGLAIKNRYDQMVSAVNSTMLDCPGLSHRDEACQVFEFEFDLLLEGGQYSLRLGLNRPPRPGEPGPQSLDSSGWFGPLQVSWDYHNEPAPFLGMFGLPMAGRLSATKQAVETRGA